MHPPSRATPYKPPTAGCAIKKVTQSLAAWKAQLTREQFEVCRMGGTERPFTGEYVDCKKTGIYCCVCCHAPLFTSQEKFDSGSGWPSFYQTAFPQNINEIQDYSLGMRRTEVRCHSCDAHLGHVFSDGPAPGGLRYCINSVALELKGKEPEA